MMKKFVIKLVWFSLPVALLFAFGLLLPITPKASQSQLLANKTKDELLLLTDSPRMIFVGGSNLSFGLNSQIIKEELNVNPINTGLNADAGIRYMLENTIQYIRQEDIVILTPEYDFFYQDYSHVSEVLFRIIFDVELSKIRLLNLQQVLGLIPYIPRYALFKFKPTEYFYHAENSFYTVDSFNEYGDTYKHWGLQPRKQIMPYKSFGEQFNPSVIRHILEFQKRIVGKKAKLYVTYPGFQESSYLSCIEQIEKIASAYKKKGIITLGSPGKYKMPDTMMFNTPYHLNKKGVDFRTRQFINDYKERMNPNYNSPVRIN